MRPLEPVLLFVLKTRTTPLRHLYRFGYWVTYTAVTIAVYILSFPFLRLGYLRRSLAMDCEVLGLSDIDLCFLFSDAISDRRLTLLQKFYGKISQFVPILDKSHEMYTLSHFRRRFETEPRFYYRVIEGKLTWKCLWGKNHLGDFKEDRTKGVIAAFCELQGYFALLNFLFFGADEKTELEKIRIQYFFYKLIVAFFRPLHLEWGKTNELKRPALVRELLIFDSNLLPKDLKVPFEKVRNFVKRVIAAGFTHSVKDEDVEGFLIPYIRGVVSHFAIRHGSTYQDLIGNVHALPPSVAPFFDKRDLNSIRKAVRRNRALEKETVFQDHYAFYNFSFTSLKLSQQSLILKLPHI